MEGKIEPDLYRDERECEVGDSLSVISFQYASMPSDSWQEQGNTDRGLQVFIRSESAGVIFPVTPESATYGLCTISDV